MAVNNTLWFVMFLGRPKESMWQTLGVQAPGLKQALIFLQQTVGLQLGPAYTLQVQLLIFPLEKATLKQQGGSLMTNPRWLPALETVFRLWLNSSRLLASLSSLCPPPSFLGPPCTFLSAACVVLIPQGELTSQGPLTCHST